MLWHKGQKPLVKVEVETEIRYLGALVLPRTTQAHVSAKKSPGSRELDSQTAAGVRLFGGGLTLGVLAGCPRQVASCKFIWHRWGSVLHATAGDQCCRPNASYLDGLQASFMLDRA